MVDRIDSVDVPGNEFFRTQLAALHVVMQGGDIGFGIIALATRAGSERENQ